MNRMLDKGARLDIDFRDEVVDDKRCNTREARVQGVLSAFVLPNSHMASRKRA